MTVSEKGGVSLNLNTSYLSPAPAGSRVFVEAQARVLGGGWRQLSGGRERALLLGVRVDAQEASCPG